MEATVNDLKERELREKQNPPSEAFAYASKQVEDDLAAAVRIFRSTAQDKKSNAEQQKQSAPA